MKKLVLFLAGVVVGLGVAAVLVMQLGPGLMISERKSPLGLEATVARLSEVAKEKGWVVSGVRKLDESVMKHGGPDVRAVRLVELCHPQHAGKILLEDDARFVSVMMPCTISVYEKSDGTVWMSSLNPGLVGRLFGGVISEVMAGPVAREQAEFLDAVK